MSGDPLPPKKRKVTDGYCLTPLGTPRYRMLWPMWILAAHLLSSSCVAQPSRNITIEIKREPPLVQVGDSVALIPGGARRNLFSCRWFRGDKYRFFEIVEYMPFNASLDYKDAYSGRESIDLYCRLHIRNLSLWDSNFYRIEKITSNNTWEAGETALLVQGMHSSCLLIFPPPHLPRGCLSCLLPHWMCAR
ncbi:pregnancy-specific glycoprotein 22-like isoform X2 [Anolis carolinensis]|uniref:pregnancy-specific glycoprotein 22-like isoform X2 n=1 Tax=Anolis carolinensis TaxID=28377 RepID=UPI002F2B6B28